MPEAERIRDKEQEKLLLISTVEELLRHEIVLRVQAEDGIHLIFPSQLTRESEDLPDPRGKAVIFSFEGPVQNVYATLVVRLSNSHVFQKSEMWRNAATYTTESGGIFGIALRELGEGYAELVLFFNEFSREDLQFQFEEYVHTHLLRRALSETINRRRIFSCPECEEEITASQARRRRELGHDSTKCPVCEAEVSLLDGEERLRVTAPSLLHIMDKSADARRDRETAASIIEGKKATGDFDVFLCHNNVDKSAVKQIGEKLIENGILPWLDEWELRPGFSWRDALETQIERIRSVAVFVGKTGTGPWQDREIEAVLFEFVERRCPVIPVLLPVTVPTTDKAKSISNPSGKPPQLPRLLKGLTWVDFRKEHPDPLEQLIWGITGRRRTSSNEVLIQRNGENSL